MRTRCLRVSGFTLSETFTVIVVLVVLAAIAVPMWHTHELRARRDAAVGMLLAVQSAQDQYFGKHARYANEPELRANPPPGVEIGATSERGFYRIAVRNSDDDLGYLATARVVPRDGQSVDTRCVELRIDQNGRRSAVDAEGADRSADCWSRD